ncbi:hypothetical protein Droror1_Dr00017372 [Drosera rotundifolia]
MRSNKKPLWRKRESILTSFLKRLTRRAGLKGHHLHPTAVRCYELPDQVRTEIVICHDRLTTIEFDLAIVDATEERAKFFGSWPSSFAVMGIEMLIRKFSSLIDDES